MYNVREQSAVSESVASEAGFFAFILCSALAEPPMNARM
jgi:hypothetical protein